MSILIDVKDWDPQVWAHAVATACPGYPILNLRSDGDRLADVRYALVWKPGPGLFARLPNLDVIFSLGAGVDHITRLPDLPDKPVVRAVNDNLSRRMSEWITLQVLVHHRQHPAYRALQKSATWRPLAQPDAANICIGFAGFGVLAQAAAAVLRRLGFRVIGWRRSPEPVTGFECYGGAASLSAFLQKCDILVSLLPHTPETRGMLDGAVFHRLRRDGPLGGPVFINAGRGGTHNEADLVRCLEDGTLKAASLDVFAQEPLSADSPLWRMDNVVITPHVAADSDPASLARDIARQIARFEAGQALENVIDRGAGY